MTTQTTLTRRRLLTLAGATTATGLAAAVVAACGSGSGTTGASGQASGGAGGSVVVVTHESFHVPDELIEAFQKDTGYTLEVVASGDAGELVNKLVLTKDAPIGDAVFGIDNTYASRALSEGVIDTTASTTLPEGASRYVVEDTPALAPVDLGEVCLNVDTAWFTEHSLTPPASFEDLLKPELKGLTVVIDPSTSSPGMAFLLATIAHFGEGAWQQYWKDLVANGARVDSGWTDAYYTDFTAGGEGGAYPVVVSYSSSPSYTVTDDGTATTTAAVLPTAIRQVEYAGVLAGAANPEGAAAFVSWMLSREVQETIPENMYMYPVDPAATLPEALKTFGPLSDAPLEVAPADIDAHREEWLAAWAEAVGM